jgi:(p)ppGpp synthase/HD superfamily hydrolase
MTSHEKEFVYLRGWLMGKEYHLAYLALELARKYHTGKRKDGVTPEFSHQVTTTLRVITFEKYLIYPEATIAVMTLHDLVEDHNFSPDDIRPEFGELVAKGVSNISKVINGYRRSDIEYYGNMAKCPIASICKGFDRDHNQKTMRGVFDPAKQLAYAEETEKYILPMFKEARNRFPQQQAIYLNLKLTLEDQVAWIRMVHQK